MKPLGGIGDTWLGLPTVEFSQPEIYCSGCEREPYSPLLLVFRSRQQADILALVLGNPAAEFTLTEIADRTENPYPSVHREISRAAAAGLVSDRRIGNSRLIRANRSSPYFDGLAEVLVRAFGPPQVLAEELAGVPGIDRAYIFGSWAARHAGQDGPRPVDDIDLLVLGEPAVDAVYASASRAEKRLGREVQGALREIDGPLPDRCR